MKTEVLEPLQQQGVPTIASAADLIAFTGTDGMKVGRVIITPLGAEAMLGMNANNRRIKQRRVDRLVQSIVDGHWHTTNDAIVMDRNGVMVNGQHRLTACVESGHAIEVLLFVGADPSSRQVIDTGVKRSLADALIMSGIDGYATTIAAVGVLHYRYTHRQLALTPAGSIGFYDRPGHDIMIDYINDHPLISQMAPVGMATYLKLRGFNQSAAGVFAAVTAEIDPVQSTQFIETLQDGENLTRGNPIYALRRLLERVYASQATTGPRRAEWSLAVGIKAWNYTRMTPPREIDTLVVRSTEQFPEAI